jgi:queuosine precursor transporter
MNSDQYSSRSNQLSDSTLPAYCFLYAVFIGGLILNTTLAVKIIDIYGLYMPAGIFLWSLTFPITVIIAETYGRRYALYLVLGGFVVSVFTFGMISLTIVLPSAPFWEHDEAFNVIFGRNSRTILALVDTPLARIIHQTSLREW